MVSYLSTSHLTRPATCGVLQPKETCQEVQLRPQVSLRHQDLTSQKFSSEVHQVNTTLSSNILMQKKYLMIACFPTGVVPIFRPETCPLLFCWPCGGHKSALLSIVNRDSSLSTTNMDGKCNYNSNANL